MHPWTLENAQAFVADLQSRVRGYDLEIMDEIYDGTYTNMIDMLSTTDGFTKRGVCWATEHAIV